MSSVDSSLTPSSNGSLRASMSSAMRSIRRDFWTWKGSSVTTIRQVPRACFSMVQRALTRNDPRPVS